MSGIRRVERISLCVVAAASILTLSTEARASFSNRVLLNAPGTLGAPFQNTQGFLATNGPDTLDISVDYAVWGPGQFPGNYTPFAGFGVPAANDYVYAYQVYNNGPGNGQSNRAFSQLGINSAGGTIDSLGKDQSGLPPIGDPGGVNTNFAFLSQQGASYMFLVPTIHVNEYSVVLLLSSPQGPAFAQASVFDSGLSASGNLPMPVPEPTTIGLLAIGAGLLRRKLRR